MMSALEGQLMSSMRLPLRRQREALKRARVSEFSLE
jgi:hypothetical protein